MLLMSMDLLLWMRCLMTESIMKLIMRTVTTEPVTSYSSGYGEEGPTRKRKK